MFCRKQVYTSRKEKVAPGNLKIEPKLTPSRRISLSLHTVRPIPLSTVHFLQPAVRPSLRTSLLAMHSPKITEIVEKSAFPMDCPCGLLWRLEKQRRFLVKIERYCVSSNFRFFGSFSHCPRVVWLLRPFQSHCTLMPIAWGTRCHDSIPWCIPRLFAWSLVCSRYRSWTFIYDARRIRCGTLG